MTDLSLSDIIFWNWEFSISIFWDIQPLLSLHSPEKRNLILTGKCKNHPMNQEVFTATNNNISLISSVPVEPAVLAVQLTSWRIKKLPRQEILKTKYCEFQKSFQWNIYVAYFELLMSYPPRMLIQRQNFNKMTATVAFFFPPKWSQTNINESSMRTRKISKFKNRKNHKFSTRFPLTQGGNIRR